MITATLAGCASGSGGGSGEVAFTPLAGQTAESQWEMHLLEGGADTALTGAMAVSLERPGDGRLYVMLPFGQTLGKCVLAGGGARCQPAAPAAGATLRKAATAVARLVAADAKAGSGGMFVEGGGQIRALRGSGWRAEVDGPWLIYREDGANWRLRLKRTG